MSELLKRNPSGKGKLYARVRDDVVISDIAVFTWDWLKKACKFKNKKQFMAHLEAGHFGPYEIVGENNYQILEGHRAICRFNNSRYKDQAVAVYTRDQYGDLLADRAIRIMEVLVHGRIMTKLVSLKNYNREDFIAVKRYTPDQSGILATDRVNIEVAEEKVDWHALPKRSDEYVEHFEQRWRFYNSMYLREVALVAKDTASEEEILRAADLPASILTLIDNKLSITQAATYVSRWLDFQKMYKEEELDNPALSFRIHQVILEEIVIEHLRDLQRLKGDVIDKSIQDALKEATGRWQNLMPIALLKPAMPSTNGVAKPETPERTAQPKESVDDEEFPTQ